MEYTPIEEASPIARLIGHWRGVIWEWGPRWEGWWWLEARVELDVEVDVFGRAKIFGGFRVPGKGAKDARLSQDARTNEGEEEENIRR